MRRAFWLRRQILWNKSQSLQLLYQLFFGYPAALFAADYGKDHQRLWRGHVYLVYWQKFCLLDLSAVNKARCRSTIVIVQFGIVGCAFPEHAGNHSCYRYYLAPSRYVDVDVIFFFQVKDLPQFF